jgi:phage baseplate assembly protein W
MLADFLGKGWAFPVERDSAHGVAISYGEMKIQQSIWIILATSPGERVMRPDFGCGIHRLVFEVNDTATRSHVKQEVADALVRWEPRIDVLDVGVEVQDAGELLLITVSYQVRATNNYFNLVYPFYLVVGA